MVWTRKTHPQDQQMARARELQGIGFSHNGRLRHEDHFGIMGARNQVGQPNKKGESADDYTLCQRRKQRLKLLLFTLPDNHKTQRGPTPQAKCGSPRVKHPQILPLLA